MILMKNLKKFNLLLMVLSSIILLGNSFLLVGNSTNLKYQNDFNLPNNSNSISPFWNFSLGEDEYVEAVAISSDGGYITAASNKIVSGIVLESTVYLFNNSLTGIIKPVWNFSISNEFCSIGISADGSSIVVGSGYDDSKVYFFDYLNPIPIWNYSAGEGRVYDVWISNDGYYIAAASGSNKAFLFNKTGPSPLWEVSTTGLALRVDASSNARFITVTDNARKLYLFNKSIITPEWTYSFSSDMSSALSMSADGNYIVSGSEAVYLFDKSIPIPIWTYPTSNYVRSVRITPDGRYIVAGCYDNNIYFFDRLNSTPIWSYLTGGELAAVDISDDGNYIVAQSLDDYMYLFNKDNSTPIGKYKLDGVSGMTYDYRLEISSDSKYVVAGGRNYLYIFDLGSIINSPDPPDPDPDPDPRELIIPGYKILSAFLIITILVSVTINYKKLKQSIKM